MTLAFGDRPTQATFGVPAAANATHEFAWDADQRALMASAAGHGPLVVWGAPGTGKSTVLIEIAAQRLQRHELEPEQIVLLAATRESAARLRNAWSQRIGRGVSSSIVRSWTAYAFDVFRRYEAATTEPLRNARLMSGAEQDLLLKELLQGHERGFAVGPQWPPHLASALLTRGFRDEVRQLIDRMADYGMTPDDLAVWGQQAARPDWQAAAQLLEEYRDVMSLRGEAAIDSVGLLRQAATLLAGPSALARQEHERYRLILIDELHEAGPAAYALLEALARGHDMIAMACPDIAVQGFRGARPDGVRGLIERLGAQTTVLNTSYRLPYGLAKAWGRVAERIVQPAVHGSRHLNRAPGTQDDRDQDSQDRVEVEFFDSPLNELRFLAESIWRLHIEGEKPLAHMVVIARSSAQVKAVERYLRSQGIPTQTSRVETAVRDEPAVQPFLLAYRVVVDPSILEVDLAVDLLTSCITGLNALQMRRLRRWLVEQRNRDDRAHVDDDVFVEFLQQQVLPQTQTPETRRAMRLLRVLAAGRKAMTQDGANPQNVLWALWSTSGLSDQWRKEALRNGGLSARAHRDLDAMMALFESAERFVDRDPAATPGAFLEYILGQELPMDSLVPQQQTQHGVEVMTPANAVGRQWPVVLVTGVQEGRWPDTRLRGEILGSRWLTEVVELGLEVARQRRPSDRVREVLDDELRMLSAAVSRASERLICTAVRSDDDQPSRFLELVLPWEGHTPERPTTEVQRPQQLRALVAELRQTLERGVKLGMHKLATKPYGAAGQGADRAIEDGRSWDNTLDPLTLEAAKVLSVLAAEQVAGADPAHWWGLLPLSSEAPIVPSGSTVTVTPSTLETVLKSPLNWLMKAAGGEQQTDGARSLGTLIHGIAEDFPHGNAELYFTELERRWATLGMPHNWMTYREKERAKGMLLKLAEYVRSLQHQQRRLLATESAFAVDLSGDSLVRLTGRVDRIEQDAQGRLVIVDLKTGRGKPTKAQVREHDQLGAYQSAVVHQAFSPVVEGLGEHGKVGRQSGGASLVQLGGTTQHADEQYQDPLERENDWVMPRIRQAATLLAAATFDAVHDPTRGDVACVLPEVCPLCRGKQVTE